MAGGKGQGAFGLPPVPAKATTPTPGFVALNFILESRVRGTEGKSYRFLRFTFAIFSSTAQTAAVSCAPKPLFSAFR